MGEAEKLALELENAVAGDPWFGPSMIELLADVDAEHAAMRVTGMRHSIWEILLHTVGWAREVTRRFGGEEPAEPEGGNWPTISLVDEDAWVDVKAELLDVHEQAIEAILSLGNQLDAAPQEALDELGQPVTFGRIAAGLAQHVAYHAGQIAIAKQVLDIAPPAE